jgi:hypothetical protein
LAKLKKKNKVLAEFNKPLFRPAEVKDTRFGIRRIYLNERDKPEAFSYADPNTNWWGTR